ncbi:hypothetical protein Syun_013493 [Stephania yunnanensis]|uniref:Xylulose kinase n=1 Tax=Stephania yunnanensis TaxID=152371 RepID=A0AAP0JJ93_9MAGN
MGDFSLPEGSLFLGFDSSTQSLKATVLDSNLNILTSETVHFDSELPHYKTKDGVYRDSSVNGRIVSPTLMWVEALDLLLEKFAKSGLEFERIVAVSGSGQQHGSVYWKNGGAAKLAALDAAKPLRDQLKGVFSIEESPIWMDSSTTVQCKAIEEAVGGALELAQLTGSRAHERFTGPQIRKIYETQPDVYHGTERISLVSSFMASILIGDYASIDETDGAGMNLMDVKERVWSKIALEATAPGLGEKLGKLAPAHAVAGSIAPYFVNRSVFGISSEHVPRLEGHVFPNPVDTKGYMVMLVYKNGSLTREVGFHRYVIENFNGETLNGVKERQVEEFDAPSEVRAVIEGNFLSMRAHAERFGMPSPPKRIIATGGASANQSILKCVASIFGCDVYTVQRPDSASLGAALRAAHGWLCDRKGSFVPFSGVYENRLNNTSLHCKLSMPAGEPQLLSKYTSFMKKRIELEDRLVQKLGRM